MCVVPGASSHERGRGWGVGGLGGWGVGGGGKQSKLTLTGLKILHKFGS